MARSTNRGVYTPQFPSKYTGEYPIIYRSSWELEFMRYCDLHPDVMEWASEPQKIPYKNPLNGNQTVYVPDFLVTYKNIGGRKSVKLIEIKPMHEAMEAPAPEKTTLPRQPPGHLRGTTSRSTASMSLPPGSEWCVRRRLA